MIASKSMAIIHQNLEAYGYLCLRFMHSMKDLHLEPDELGGLDCWLRCPRQRGLFSLVTGSGKIGTVGPNYLISLLAHAFVTADPAFNISLL